MLRKFPASHFIKMAMEIKDMSAEELARQSNVPAAEISMILNNKTPFTIKNDVKIGPVLDYPIGFLSRLESVYQEWRLYQPENWKEIKVEDYCFCYRKHKNVNEEKFKKTIILAARKIKEAEAIKVEKDFNSVFYNDYLTQINDIHNANDFKEAMLKLNSLGINIYLFDGVNIRGFSKLFQDKMYVFINKNLNATIDSFIMTLTHELIHHIDLSNEKIKLSLVDDEKQESLIDDMAINFMLKQRKGTIDEILNDNDHSDLSVAIIKEWAKSLEINWVYLLGYFYYSQKKFQLKFSTKEIMINYEDDIWADKNI